MVHTVEIISGKIIVESYENSLEAPKGKKIVTDEELQDYIDSIRK